MKNSFLMLAVCAAWLVPNPSVAGSSEAEALRARAQAYWRARVERSPQLKEFYVPEDKGGPAKKTIRTGRAMELESASVERVEITDDTAMVEVALRVEKFNFAMSPQMARMAGQSDLIKTKRLQNRWILIDGTWYREMTQPFGGALDKHTTSAAPVEAANSSSGEGARSLPTDRRQDN